MAEQTHHILHEKHFWNTDALVHGVATQTPEDAN